MGIYKRKQEKYALNHAIDQEKRKIQEKSDNSHEKSKIQEKKARKHAPDQESDQ